MNTATAHILDAFIAPIKPKLGFIGIGHVGTTQMQMLMDEHIADCCTLYDPSLDAASMAAAMQSGITVSNSLADILSQDLDGVVVASPTAMHGDHCIAALKTSKAVFCHQPLAPTVAETQQIFEAARVTNKLLSVDFSYRYLPGVETLKQKVAMGEFGEIYAADLVFHSAYGPDKTWNYNVSTSGGGCVMDLGTHLIDLAIFILGNRDIKQVSSNLMQRGKALLPPYEATEDYATAEFLHGRTRTRLTCSWGMHAGRDAIIELRFYGTLGGGSITNVNGSFNDFEVHQFAGNRREKIARATGEHGGRALIDWAKTLCNTNRFDPDIEQIIPVADVVDRIYCR